jgi:hypothetical protein
MASSIGGKRRTNIARAARPGFSIFTPLDLLGPTVAADALRRIGLTVQADESVELSFFIFDE